MYSNESAFKHDFHTRFLWVTTVQKYSATKLTRYTDVLEAVSGVASSLQRWAQGKYLAGLWMEVWVDLSTQ